MQWKQKQLVFEPSAQLSFFEVESSVIECGISVSKCKRFCIYRLYAGATLQQVSIYRCPVYERRDSYFFKQISTVYRFSLQRGDGIYTVYTKMQANLGVGEIHVNCGAQRACGAGTLEFVSLWDETWWVGKSDAGKGSKPARQIYFAYRFIP